MAENPDKNVVTVDIISARGIQEENHTYLRNLQLHLLCEGESIQSDIIPFSTDPEVRFNFSASFNMQSDLGEIKSTGRHIYVYISQSFAEAVDSSLAMQEHQPVGTTYSRTLVAEAVIDSRLAFLHNGDFLSVELVPCNCGGIVDTGFCGILFVKLTASGPLSSFFSMKEDEQASLNLETIKNNIEIQQKVLEKLNYDQYQAIKLWFSCRRADYPYIEDRRIKLFSLDECGRHRMVCNFIGRLTPPRSIDSPRFAARFVSLLPFHRGVELIGGNISSWHSAHSTLLKMQGDVEDHALLLCSLLLGWGLDAYVVYGTILPPGSIEHEAIGTTALRSMNTHFHYWVVTVDSLVQGVQATKIFSTQPKEKGVNNAGKSGQYKVLEHSHVTFWEPLTGQQFRIDVSGKKKFYSVLSKDKRRLIHSSPQSDINVRGQMSLNHPFQSIYALFRHDRFLLNIQKNPLVSSEVDSNSPVASFDLWNERFWAILDNPHHVKLQHPGATAQFPFYQQCQRESIQLQKYYQQKNEKNHKNDEFENENETDSVSEPKILRIPIDISLLEQRLEAGVKSLITSIRADTGLQTRFDQHLALLLQPALAAYEMDRATGTSFGNDDFQVSIKRAVARGECFKAYPTCFAHTHLPTIISALRRANAFNDLICVAQEKETPETGPPLEGQLTRHAVRVKIIDYPERACAVWLVVAVCFLKS